MRSEPILHSFWGLTVQLNRIIVPYYSISLRKGHRALYNMERDLDSQVLTFLLSILKDKKVRDIKCTVHLLKNM